MTATFPLGLGEPDAEALAFPREILDGVKSALLLFASGRGGATDGRWFAEAGIEDVTLVDWDEKTLKPMVEVVPPVWDWEVVDVMSFADRGSLFRPDGWDHISADPPSQLAPALLESVPNWLSMARKSATITLYRHCFVGEPSLDAPEVVAPVGWIFTKLIKRGEFRGGIYWLLGERV